MKKSKRCTNCASFVQWWPEYDAGTCRFGGRGCVSFGTNRACKVFLPKEMADHNGW